MRTRRIGRTDLEVTEIGCGGAPIGGLFRAVSREAALATLEAAWAAGHRYFDTAPFYGFGLSERFIGDFLRDKPEGSWVLSTKVGRLLRPVPRSEVPDHGYVEPLPFTVDYDYSYDGIMRSVEASFARLGLSRIDILYVHDIGVFTHGAEATVGHLRQLFGGGLKALDELKSAGVIRAYGLGVNEVEISVEVLTRSPLDCILLAGRYTLLDRSAVATLIPLCETSGCSLVIGGVFNSGILATGPVENAYFNYAPAPDDVKRKVAGLASVAAEHGLPLAAAALQFPLRNPVVASVLIGAADPALLALNMELAGRPVPDAAWPAFDAHTIA